MKTLTKNILLKTAEAGVFATTFLPAAAHAAPASEETTACADPSFSGSNPATIGDGANCGKSASNPDNLFGDGGIFTTIANILIFLIGAVSVIVLIYGGFQYVTSTGDAKRVEGAKNTILYAIIGIVVALLAFAIVNFVVSSLGVSGTDTGAPAAN